MKHSGSILVLGLGNTLLSDDGVGVHVLQCLEKDQNDKVSYCEGGTLGLSLLPDIENATSLIVIDAAELRAKPGTMRTFIGADMDVQIGGRKKSAHEVALSDLIDTATLMGRKPERRALIAIQPETINEWGLYPTPPIAAAIPAACDAVRTLIKEWC